MNDKQCILYVGAYIVLEYNILGSWSVKSVHMDSVPIKMATMQMILERDVPIYSGMQDEGDRQSFTAVT